MIETIETTSVGAEGDTDVYLYQLTSGAVQIVAKNSTSTIQLCLDSVEALDTFAQLVYWDEDEDDYDDESVLPPFRCDSPAGTCIECSRHPAKLAFAFVLDSKVSPTYSHMIVQYLYGDELWDFIGAFRYAHEEVHDRYCHVRQRE